MTAIKDASIPQALLARVKGLILHPRAEWETIDAEPATAGGLYRRYILILAAIGPVASLIGGLLFGFHLGRNAFAPAPVNALVGAVVGYGLTLAGVYVLALLIDNLAPYFKAKPDRIQALKVAAYSATAAWLASIFGLVPQLAILSVFGAYSGYLIFLGLNRLMNPASRPVIYALVVFVSGLVMMLIIASLATQIMRIGLEPELGSGDARPLATARKAKAASAAPAPVVVAAPTPKATPVVAPPSSGEQLQVLMPEDLKGGFVRQEVGSSSTGAAGVAMASSKAVYAKGASRITLEVTDMSSAGAVAAAFNARSNRETPTGYEKVGPVNGRVTTEAYDRSQHGGRYSVLVANRFLVEAKGEQVTIGDLSAAVTAVDFARLESMAKG
ncbi:hypothetical protein BH11PSE2_BH11PSE2_04740 [soil metagenome]